MSPRRPARLQLREGPEARIIEAPGSPSVESPRAAVVRSSLRRALVITRRRRRVRRRNTSP
eukprot:1142908-Rhodomonas_salina.1